MITPPQGKASYCSLATQVRPSLARCGKNKRDSSLLDKSLTHNILFTQVPKGKHDDSDNEL